MKRSGILLTGLLVALMVGSAVWAQNPHFLTVTATLEEDGSLRVCFKEAGLGNNQNINYEATAEAAATYQCVNNGGNCPNAANKRKVTAPVSASGTFTSGQNGQISQCLVLEPPAVEPFCPGGQEEVLAELAYKSIKITDTTNNVSKKAKPGSVSVTLFVCP